MAAEQYDDGGESVESLHRFLADPAAHKMIVQLISVYARSKHTDDDTVDDLELPTLKRNDVVLVTKSIFDLLDDMLASSIEDDSEAVDDEEEDDEEVAAFSSRKLTVELAKDKRMSTYYKAFMGNMRSLVNPWHSNKNDWLQKWLDMGMDLYAKSPAKEPKKTYTLILKEDGSEDETEEDQETSDDSEVQEEDAAVIGSHSALPTAVMHTITEMGFTPVSLNHLDDSISAAWVKTGVDEGFPDMQVTLAVRSDNSYLISYSKVNKHDWSGKVIRKQVLNESASAKSILDTLSLYYDLMIGT